MDPRYDIKEVEARIYTQWENSGFFNPDVCIEQGVTRADAEPFSLVLPPPNVTGTLHIGHAFEDTIQDVVVRYQRMRGKRTLWIPGTDHAAIATQAKVEKKIEKEEGKRKYDLGREEFLRRVDAFAKESHDTIVRQVRRLGASLDWSREAYTLDPKRAFAVRTAFKKMYDLGLIYRGDRVVNWDPKGQTVISDDEIVYEERRAKLYTFRYAKDFPIAISTTRPETKVGDTAVAVHPADPRYEKYIGQEFKVSFCGVPLLIKVIADESVEREFGTGALGVTPAHSMIDWEMAQKHGLPLISVIDEHARMKISDAPESPLNGLKTTEAREKIVEALRADGLLEKEEDVSQNVSTAERTGGIIEPLPKLQWFIGVNKSFTQNGKPTTLKTLMHDAVASGNIRMMPERFERVYYHWIENLRDWCISRQLWFGHQIPVWYQSAQSNETDKIYCGINPPEGDDWEQDPDTLDTWFSSGLWPFSTLGWPDTDAADFRTYFPNSFMAPGYEILFFWVARMILMSTALTGKIPFHTVYLHGIVRDSKGEKFSKSKGNGIDPLELAEKYGADALRMALIAGAAPGNDVKFDEQRVKGYRNFATKIWNIARFIEMSRNGNTAAATDHDADGAHTDTEHEYLREFAALKSEITAHLDAYDFHLASEKIYHYLWHTLADKIIEAEKPKLRDGSAEEKATSYALLEYLLLESLKLLHPFMPFITEEIYQIFRPGKMLMVEAW
jgi:valyl-tRNA synthetase